MFFIAIIAGFVAGFILHDKIKDKVVSIKSVILDKFK
jgi:hypothetical protein